MRWARALVLPAMILMVVACSAPTASTGGGDGSQQSQTAQPSTDGGGGGGGGGTGSDVDALAEKLVPPNSTEASRFSGEGTLLVAYSSSDSADSVVSFYENKLNELGIHVMGKSTAGETTTFVIGNEDGSGVQGGVSIAPDQNAGNTLISITLGTQ
jgi:hypothetical protein